MLDDPAGTRRASRSSRTQDDPADQDLEETERLMAYRGAIFDVDGVLVDSPHELAWRQGP